jgi:hypothetical protein
MSKIQAVPLELKEANDFVRRYHRHHAPVIRDKYRIGAELDGKLVGVVQVARPVARMLCDGKTLEVVRLCTDGTKNVCSFLYSAAARIAREMGYTKIITYILASESGDSLRACGWELEASVKGQSWSREARPRKCTAPTCNKQRWSKTLTVRAKTFKEADTNE